MVFSLASLCFSLWRWNTYGMLCSKTIINIVLSLQLTGRWGQHAENGTNHHHKYLPSHASHIHFLYSVFKLQTATEKETQWIQSAHPTATAESAPQKEFERPPGPTRQGRPMQPMIPFPRKKNVCSPKLSPTRVRTVEGSLSCFHPSHLDQRSIRRLKNSALTH